MNNSSSPRDSGGDSTASAPSTGLFRQEALTHHVTRSEEGNLLRVAPAWATWTWWFLLFVVVVGLGFLFAGSAPIYVSGPAVLRVSGAAPLNSPMEGTIEAVDVLPGQRVTAGQVLVRFRAQQEKAQLEMIESEFELQLLSRLRKPNDMSAGMELRRLRPELDRARSGVERSLIRAPNDGAVQDVRIEVGDFLRVGDHVLTVVPVEQEYSVVAFLPGHALPQLREGMPVRLRMTGYSYAYVSTSIESLGRQVIGPREARRYLGSEIEDAMELSGPVVVVRCRLRGDSFMEWKQPFRVYDGLRATAAVEVRRDRVIDRLIPGMRRAGATP